MGTYRGKGVRHLLCKAPGPFRQKAPGTFSPVTPFPQAVPSFPLLAQKTG